MSEESQEFDRDFMNAVKAKKAERAEKDDICCDCGLDIDHCICDNSNDFLDDEPLTSVEEIE